MTECVLVLAAGCALVLLSQYHVLNQKIAAVQTLASRGSEAVAGTAEDAARRGSEVVSKKLDEYIWTKDETVYRKGAGKDYDESGKLEKDELVRRTGITYNNWSRVVIDEDEYYVESASLTDEVPLNSIIYPGQKGEYQKYALSLFADYGWTAAELEPLINLWESESHWNPSAHNGRTGAHGIPQAVPAGKMASEGSDYYTNGNTQVRWGLGYIKGRYGSPSNAWAKFQSSGWY